MKAIQKGSLIAVAVSRDEVAAFKRRWPCSTLPDKAITFYFDKLNGDIVDILPYDIDGPDLLALSMDAQAYGMQQYQATA